MTAVVEPAALFFDLLSPLFDLSLPDPHRWTNLENAWLGDNFEKYGTEGGGVCAQKEETMNVPKSTTRTDKRPDGKKGTGVCSSVDLVVYNNNHLTAAAP